jgi:hypothetical protein
MSPGQRSSLFREVNDRIYDLLETAEPDLPGEFLCECGRDCGRRVLLLPSELATLRRTGQLVRSSECRGPRFGLRRRSPPARGARPHSRPASRRSGQAEQF